MKKVRSHLAVIGCLLLTHTTSHADDSKTKSAGVDVGMNKAVSHETGRVLPPTTVPSIKSSKNFGSQGQAVIGGPTNKFKNTAALNGTGMKRKP